MKRSEMVDHIYEEIVEMISKRQYSSETDEKYYKRKATGLLDMLEGFGMVPPYYNPFDMSLGEAETQVRYYRWEPENPHTGSDFDTIFDGDKDDSK